MTTLRYNPDLYVFREKSTVEEFCEVITDLHDDKIERNICQFWGCHEECEAVEDIGEYFIYSDCCEYHNKIIDDVFTAKLKAFIMNEPELMTKIKSYMEQHLELINSVFELFTDDNWICIGNEKRHGIRYKNTTILAEKPLDLFMWYIMHQKRWLMNSSNFIEWVRDTDSDTIQSDLVNMVAFMDHCNGETYYIKDIDNIDFVEIICHNISFEIKDVFTSQIVSVSGQT